MHGGLRAAAGSAKHVTELDGVRGLAILLVLMNHFGGSDNDAAGWLGAAFQRLAAFGWCGVDLFFVLSGFLITGILIDARGSATFFRNFYIRRALRILPVYYVAVSLYFFVLVPLLRIVAPGRPATINITRVPPVEQLWYWVHLSNWRIAYDISYGGIEHFWSLAIEEQFYLLWPFVVFLFSRRALLCVCACIIATSFTLRTVMATDALLTVHPNLLYCLTPFRIEPLALGATIAIAIRDERFRRSWPIWSTAASIIGGACLWWVTRVPPDLPARLAMARLGFSGVGLIAASLVLYAALRSGTSAVGAALLRQPLLVELGRLSYGIYVIHGPLSLLSHPAQTGLKQYVVGLPASLLILILGTTASYVIARMSWRFIEEPFLRRKQSFPYDAIGNASVRSLRSPLALLHFQRSCTSKRAALWSKAPF